MPAPKTMEDAPQANNTDGGIMPAPKTMEDAPQANNTDGGIMPAPKTMEEDPGTVYIRNANGGVLGVTEQHYDQYLTQVGQNGKKYPLPGYEVLSKADAQAANPRLFGAPDDRIVYTDDEVYKRLQREQNLKALRELEAENHR